ncbi:MAG: transcription-repair coupling factor [Opitutaceae bacterium]|nr:transcription-repair coupling factor [Opitutaceae bacterium]
MAPNSRPLEPYRPPLPTLHLTGICPPARGIMLAHLALQEDFNVAVAVVDTLKEADRLAEDIALFYQIHAKGRPNLEVLVFPESMPDAGDMREAFAASADRLTVLNRLKAKRSPATAVPGKLMIVATPGALVQEVPALEAYARHELTLEIGQTYKFADLLQKLHDLDYDSEAVCEAPGHYAVRGGIIDVYPVTATAPYRIDFFGDEIESIRSYDPVTQRSSEPVPTLTLSATPRLKLDPAKTGLSDYLPESCHLVLVEPVKLEGELSRLASEGKPAASFNALRESVSQTTLLSDLDEATLFASEDTLEETLDSESLSHHRRYPDERLVAQERLVSEEEARADFLKTAARWKKEGFTFLFVASKDGEEQRMREILADHPSWKGADLLFLRGALNEGFRIRFPNTHNPSALQPFRPSTSRESDNAARITKPKEGLAGPRPAPQNPHPNPPILQSSSLPILQSSSLVVITETEVFGRQRVRRPIGNRRAQAQRAQIDQLLDFSELVEGDFVVHLQHGIALYRGLTKVEFAGGNREVISLEFDNHVTLHVPLQESHLISRYVGLSKTKPQLGRIGSNRWEKTRQSAERSTLDLAAELLRIQAAREAQPGFAFPEDNTWQKEFEASFPYPETRDQLRAIEETKADMERTRPMDRLICGDVGFGKTEVAIRAAFKAVQGGRQVAVLVPTTVLAQQHLNTFRERMAGYPVSVEMVSRFRSRTEQQKILAATAAGQVDILIGTHRLLAKDVAFKELGLVVIDEEQRFGVKHKETFKQLRTSVDVLSMSATPIPRTLYLAMTGARDMSVIETAPVNRLPVQTIVKTYDEKLVVEAVRHELRRGGQVFYLHNRVQTIDLVAARLRELMPDLRIGIGHGQMDEKDLEQRMTEFVAGEYDMLVCTTIIESGLDIPNCNTIIIEGADRFGLSQLYQLRGRVGRFKHQAYAYLLLHRHTRMLDLARQRLNALRSHNQLGAGFRIAMRDLELRGAGNLLGAEQSGHIVGVGFELYCQLLRQSVSRLKGEKTAQAIRANVKLDFVTLGEGVAGEAAKRRHEDGYTAIRDAEREESGAVEVAPIRASLPASYIGETRLRFDFYRKLAMADNPKTLREIESDLTDRFGKFGDAVKALLLVTEIRIRAEQKGIQSVETDSSRLKCLRSSGQRDDFVMVGTRFPRLTAPKPLLRLREIIAFLNNLPNP